MDYFECRTLILFALVLSNENYFWIYFTIETPNDTFIYDTKSLHLKSLWVILWNNIVF